MHHYDSCHFGMKKVVVVIGVGVGLHTFIGLSIKINFD